MEWTVKSFFIWGFILLALTATHQTDAAITPGNVAPRGIATQSAEPASAATGPDMAIDDYRSPDPEKTCASVPSQDNPWWQLDLRSIYHITAVSVIGMASCCQEQLDGAEIRVGLRNDSNNEKCAIISAVKGQHKYDFQCGVMLGRFVHVLLPGRQRNLTVCEVQVYGTVLVNVALRGVAFQSSSRWRTAGKASSVVDGVEFTTCSITEDKPSQWVKVDLLVPYNVTVIQLIFTEDCCYGVEVHVDNVRCSGTPSSFQSVMTLDCGGIIGRSVTVFHPEVPLTLCEVAVFSNWENPENKFPQRPPPPDYCSFDHCSRDYVVIDEEPMTWFQARTYCRERYSGLAAIGNAQDMNRVVDKMYEKNIYNFWIGLHEDVLNWRWSMSGVGYYENGQAEYRNWAAGEPRNEMGVRHCVGIQDSGEWKDLDCESLNYFLCFDGRDDASQSKILVQTPMTWADAQQHCRESHSDLVSVRTAAENEEIRSMVPAGMLVWIGLAGDSWKWSDGRDTLFRYWHEGQPVSSGTEPSCAHVSGGAWEAKSCDAKSAFLCYHYKKSSVVRISADFNMCDPVIQQQVQKQLEEKMKKKGISDFKIHWRMSGKLTSHNGDISVCAAPSGGKA